MTQWSPRAGIGRRIEGLVHYTVWVPSMAGAFFAGLLIFEILVYIGVRECRFANPPGAGSRPAHEPPSTTPPAR